MIAVILEGRLGNQLFQYAFAYATSKKLKTNFYLDKSIQPILLTKYFVLYNRFNLLDQYVFSISGFKNFFTYYLRIYFYYLIRRIYNLKDIEFSDTIMPKIQLNKISRQSIFKGFFQSEEYFEAYKAEILEKLRLKKKYIDLFEEIYFKLEISSKVVVIHLRRGDYLSLDIHLPGRYYHNAISLIHNSENFYIIISDDPEFAKIEFNYLPNKYISSHSEIIDLQFLIHADICILSNSSFSWWGAYLNKKKPKVIAPRYWLGLKEKKECPMGVILDNWDLIAT
ncbi:alpha-1,2-fucosyltransferase [Pedobacter miscanthi]|uniref:alpha-1,2-fucosyltransferase n=1 Tax=Pedobacter miscanthi TaxID=2259170 RepID=UPI00292F0303|nr:alpha-1,2-fucosyltransferase [Pedobacter miscanthi]